LGKISRNSEVKSMQIDKLKGTLVDFNQLEHVLDDASSIDAWQLEIRKCNDDPMDLDELVLHVHKLGDVSDDKVTRELSSRFLERTEIRPNRIVFHSMDEIRRLLGVGTQLKEQKVVDRRPRKSSQEGAAPVTGPGMPGGSASGLAALEASNDKFTSQLNIEVKS
jgi:hypothetical protein